MQRNSAKSGTTVSSSSISLVDIYLKEAVLTVGLFILKKLHSFVFNAIILSDVVNKN